MKLFRLATTLVAMTGLALASVLLATTASAGFAIDGPDTAAQLVPPPAVSPVTTSTSLWWFVLVALGAATVTVLAMLSARALRGRRMMPVTG